MKHLSLGLLFAALSSALVCAETYRSVPVSKLQIEGDKQEIAAALGQEVSAYVCRLMDARVGTECYLSHDDAGAKEISQNRLRVVFKGDAKLPLKGAIDLSKDAMGAEVKTFRFTISEGSTEVMEEKDFIEARKQWALARQDESLPGVAWFRHQAGHSNEEDGPMPVRDLNSTFDIFSGGRAIADNLALDRDLLLATGKEGETVRIDTIEGVTVKAIDWTSQLPKEEVAVDPLALFIPEDQHALFAPSLPGLLKLMNQLETEATPIAGMISSDSPYNGLLKRYRQQLGLDLGDAAALLLPVRSVAVTGGDPYFATGTDVAVLMETAKAAALFKALELAVQTQAGAAPKRHQEKNLDRVSFVFPEKGISSHICKLGDLVFVTNSLAQVRRVTEVADKRAPALGKTDEFKVFRHRYPKADEHAFIFLSDATIRRWAGPVTRIGASRRNRALAALNELTCRAVTSCGKDGDFAPLLGRVAMVKGRAISEHYGSAEFLTPISELGLAEVTSLEKEAYEQWRRGYESGWSEVFDPIAIQLKITDNALDVDLTVLPLSVNSDIDDLMEVAGESKITPRSRLRPEGSMLRLACAIDPKSKFFDMFDQQLVSMMPELKIKPLSWVGDSVSVDFLDSLYWEGIGHMGMMDQIGKMPLVARVEVKSKLKLGLFLTALRTMMQTTAPDAMKWTNHKHGERTYVVISQQEEDDFGESIRVCYAIVGDALLVTLSEKHLKRAMDLEQMELSDDQLKKLPQAKSLMLDADPALLQAIDRMGGSRGGHSRLATVSWEAIPILNEWRLRYPERDPAEVHQSLFGVSLGCPGGKGYRWNQEHLTMESVVYGHRGATRKPKLAPQGLAKYGRVHSGIDFEEDGLRLRLHLGPKVELPSLPQPEAGEVIGKGLELIGYEKGTTLTYQNTMNGVESSWKTVVKSIEKTPEGTKINYEMPWEEEGESGVWKGVMLVDDKGIWQLEGGDEFSTSTYEEPELDLPLELRLNAVHLSESAGKDTYDFDGEREVEDMRSRTELRVVGLETVKTKAGTFKDCVLVERYTENLSGPNFYVSDGKEWYHPGTGLVKSMDQTGVSELIKIEGKK